MVSKIVEPEVEETQETNEEDTLETLAIEDEVEETVEEPEQELPQKFQGKSSSEIAEAYENLEKELGRKGQEIGELRKLTDSFLQTQITHNKETTTDTEDLDFYDNPEAAVRTIIERHPKFREFTQQTQQQQASMTAQQLEKTHPDFKDVVTSPDFQEWIEGSKIRQRLFKEADAYDYDSADELLTIWKERQMISKTKEVEAEKETTRKAALKTGKGVSRTSSESTAGKKIYRRADLIRLKQTDPNRYDTLAEEIFSAYQDGRVK